MKNNRPKFILKLIVVIIVILLGLYLWKTLTSSSSTSQNMTDSPNGTQIIGDNNTVNKEATYSWSNKDSWKGTLSKVNLVHNKPGIEFDLIFTASKGIVPTFSCLKIQSDAEIYYGHPGGFYSFLSPPPENPTKNYSACFPGLGNFVDMKVGFDSMPNTITAELIKIDQ